eukprot:CAMPEP_0194215064 /NCGR_PEP_ID=MMETSP0156-20130528/16576_1 /TAXON_ID=33649 /ORGANISM="Thalassionema nitzschioides, Strain L26-B" /LENGTH=442 /DNA_ID=CAMNT_0038943483 /DNA_START=340 /DNA_END=1668 /DNA_ORIENTATION=+
MTLLLPNTRLFLTGDSDIPNAVGTSLLISNHVMDGDWLSVLLLGRCVGLRGSIKVFLRNECLQVQPQKRNTSMNGHSSSSALLTRSDSKQKVAAKSDTKTTKSCSFKIGNGSNGNCRKSSFFVSLAAQLLHTLLDFPVLSGENNYVEEREDLFSLLKSFAETQGTPVHLLLFPEGWSLHGTKDRKSVLAKSNDFAKREGRPQLKQLLLPRTTGFNACLESLREASPVVYDVTMAYQGYNVLESRSLNSDDDSTIMPKVSLRSLWRVLRKPGREIYVRIKKYSMEEVLRDASWMDKQWAEKDRLLNHFSRHQQFPADNRGFCRHRVFVPGDFQVESAIMALALLVAIPFFVPVIILLSIPIFWIVLWMWLLYQSYKVLFPGTPRSAVRAEGNSHSTQFPENVGDSGSAANTPFFPATPFASPSMSNWQDMIGNLVGKNHQDVP